MVPSAGFSAGSPPEEEIDQSVADQYPHPHDHLEPRCQPGGVEDRFQVVPDEIAAVTGFTPQAPEMILNVGQGTDPAGQLHDGSPDCGRQVQPRQPWASEHGQAAEDHEQDEGNGPAPPDRRETSRSWFQPSAPGAVVVDMVIVPIHCYPHDPPRCGKRSNGQDNCIFPSTHVHAFPGRSRPQMKIIIFSMVLFALLP